MTRPVARYDLDQFLDGVRRTGTVVNGPVHGGPDDEPEPVEWLVTAHRGMPADSPYRLALDEHEFRMAVERDTGLIESWWPGGDARARAYAALLVSFDAAVVRVDRTPHGFVQEDGRVR
jgi:hypothetical protein